MGQRDQDPKKLKRGTNNKIIDQFWARSNHRNKKMLNITTGKFHPFLLIFFSTFSCISARFAAANWILAYGVTTATSPHFEALGGGVTSSSSYPGSKTTWGVWSPLQSNHPIKNWFQIQQMVDKFFLRLIGPGGRLMQLCSSSPPPRIHSETRPCSSHTAGPGRTYGNIYGGTDRLWEILSPILQTYHTDVAHHS